MSIAEKIKAHCNTCSNTTAHDVLHSVRREWEEKNAVGFVDYVEIATYKTIQCCGCEDVKMMVLDSGYFDDISPTYFPPATFRRKPEWMNSLLFDSMFDGIHKTLYDLLSEVYKALQNDMPRLAAMGVRALLESVMLDKVGDKGTFAQNLEAFIADGHIAKSQKARIETVLDAGSAVIHRSHLPSSKDVIAMVNLTENLIESLYFHEAQINAVAQTVPPRPKRKS